MNRILEIKQAREKAGLNSRFGFVFQNERLNNAVESLQDEIDYIYKNANLYIKLATSGKEVWDRFSVSAPNDNDWWSFDHKGVKSLKEFTPLLKHLRQLGWKRNPDKETELPKNGLTDISYHFVYTENPEIKLRFNTHLIVGNQDGDGCYRVQIGEKTSAPVPIYEIICPDNELEE